MYSVMIEGVASRLLAQYCEFLVEQGDLETAPTPQQAVESVLFGFFDSLPEFAVYRAALRKQQIRADQTQMSQPPYAPTRSLVVHVGGRKNLTVRDAA